MNVRASLYAILASAAVAFAALGPSAHAQTAASLTGKVSSVEEGVMEGVIVSAKKGIVTVSVVTNDKGEFSFPASKLAPGEYTLSIKAGGYDLDGPKNVTLASKPSAIDVKLVKTKNIAPQLSNQEWIHSVPGTRDEKRILSRCVNCHSIERVVTSKYTAPELVATMERMATYSNNSFFMKPQVRAMARDMERFAPNAQKDAAYLASINLSAGERKWEPKPLPRVTGRGTRVIITEYDLPRPETQPHDVIVDKEGIVWYSDFSDQFLGRFDPKTLEIKEYPVPLHREGFPTGALDLEVDPDGNMWMALMFQAGIAKFDKKSEKIQTWKLPEGVLKEDSQQAMVGAQNWTVDGKVWMTDPSLPGLYRMDMKTGETEKWEPYKNLPKAPHSVYGIYSDKDNNIWFLDFGGENVGFIDAKTKEVTLYPTPTKRSRPRRGRFDNEGKLWFAEFGGERIGMFDTKTKLFKEWELPTSEFVPYDVVRDKNGDIWAGGMNADKVIRFNTETAKMVEYPLPRYTNIRRVFVDDSTTPPTFWVGNNHGAAIIKLEPLD
jgi:virginiamycin B lyase